MAPQVREMLVGVRQTRVVFPRRSLARGLFNFSRGGDGGNSPKGPEPHSITADGKRLVPQSELEDLEAGIRARSYQYARFLADAENTRKSGLAEKERIHQVGLRAFANELAPLERRFEELLKLENPALLEKDSEEARALRTLHEGLVLINTELVKVLSKYK